MSEVILHIFAHLNWDHSEITQMRFLICCVFKTLNQYYQYYSAYVDSEKYVVDCTRISSSTNKPKFVVYSRCIYFSHSHVIFALHSIIITENELDVNSSELDVNKTVSNNTSEKNVVDYNIRFYLAENIHLSRLDKIFLSR